ncbi:TetR/AcrR family transcriptional regulator [Alkalibacillus haloalkaliphilus]|uniref:TetR family transcriptional regulator n=1 Tax=Alkalibacillus haloalkaliphilus TaxID=94136 RepID=A0A511VZH8_9BACI|nr:TetR/AcrR family transcriptional regulator [Alkalibacillus haloalkaliphilus]GEN44244.1 TetR family transcriptional regulator [Alkalibacillus haloalkaliphilus]
MQEKKIEIIKASIDLFAEKGFHVTSVQEIVDRANVAKGSFYNYFTSKNDLIRAIYDFYFAVLEEAMTEQATQTEDPKQQFQNQLAVFFEFFLNNKPLIKMIMKEQIPIDRDMETFMTEMKQQHYDWLNQNIQRIYGSEVEPYIYDVLVIVDGMLQSYNNWILVDEESIDVDQLPKFIINRIETLCEQLINEKEATPIKQKPDFLDDQLVILTRIRQKVFSVMSRNQNKALEALSAIDKELKKEEPERIVLDSLLMNLETYSEIRKDARHLRTKLNV